MSAEKSFKVRNRFWLQTAAFCLIILPSIGLYFSVLAHVVWLVWFLLALVIIGMVMAMSST
ncbi:MAG: hypothetical protein GTO18_07125 [Anaerolineales bacterium]|nr:hypothetical protein [Anaerolineales bacterium]